MPSRIEKRDKEICRKCENSELKYFIDAERKWDEEKAVTCFGFFNICVFELEHTISPNTEEIELRCDWFLPEGFNGNNIDYDNDGKRIERKVK